MAFLYTDLDQIDYSPDSSHNIFSTGGEFSYFTELHAPTQAAHSYVFLIQQWVTKVTGRGNNPYWPLPSNDVVHGYEHWGCFTLCFTLHWWLVKTVTRIFLSVTVLTSFPDCGIDNMATDDNQMKWQQKTHIGCSLNENFSKSRSLSTIQWKTFEGENFREFRGFVTIYESFLREIGGWGMGGEGVLWHSKSEQSAKIIFFTNLRKFFPSNVSRYTVLLEYSWECGNYLRVSTIRRLLDGSSLSWVSL